MKRFQEKQEEEKRSKLNLMCKRSSLAKLFSLCELMRFAWWESSDVWVFDTCEHEDIQIIYIKYLKNNCFEY